MKVKIKNIESRLPVAGHLDIIRRHTTPNGSGEIDLSTLIDEVDIQSALWALVGLDGADRELRLFAAECAEAVLRRFENLFPEDKGPRECIEAAKAYAEGTINEEELKTFAAYEGVIAARYKENLATSRVSKYPYRAAKLAAKAAVEATNKCPWSAAWNVCVAYLPPEESVIISLYKKHFCK